MALVLHYQSAGPASLTEIFVMVAIVAALLAYYAWSREQRTRSLQKMMRARGLKSLAYTLPADFPRKMLDEMYHGWVLPRWSGVHNAIGGEEGEDFILVFDMMVARGKGTYRRTMVARRVASPQADPKIPRGYVYSSSGPWRIATKERGRFSTSFVLNRPQIEELWSALK